MNDMTNDMTDGFCAVVFCALVLSVCSYVSASSSQCCFLELLAS